MRIGIDVRPLQNANRLRGIGRYSSSLLAALAEIAPGTDEFVLFVDPALPAPVFEAARLSQARRRAVEPDRAKDTRFVRRFVSMLDPARPTPADVDVFLQLDPWGAIPVEVASVAVFYDAIPLLFPAPAPTSGVRRRVGHRLDAQRLTSILRGYRRANRVAAISDSAREDYLRLVDRRSRRVRVVGAAGSGRSAADLLAADPIAADPVAADTVPDGDYLLYVGGVDQRKNVVQLLTELARLRLARPHLSLVVVGDEFTDPLATEPVGWSAYLREHPDLADAVIVTGFVDEQRLAALYAGARAFVFPSRYEGFGLPVLEAMEFGCPVVCYDNSSLRVVGGSAALLVADGAPLAPAIERLLDEPDLRDRLVAAGRAHAATFRWDDVASAVYDLLVDAAGEGPQRERIRDRAWRAVSSQVVTWYSRRNP